jgi:hypothetical protein
MRVVLLPFAGEGTTMIQSIHAAVSTQTVLPAPRRLAVNQTVENRIAFQAVENRYAANQRVENRIAQNALDNRAQENKAVENRVAHEALENRVQANQQVSNRVDFYA